jgi:hypothetical protein
MPSRILALRRGHADLPGVRKRGLIVIQRLTVVAAPAVHVRDPRR